MHICTSTVTTATFWGTVDGASLSSTEVNRVRVRIVQPRGNGRMGGQMPLIQRCVGLFIFIFML